MFKVTAHKQDISVKECIASTFSELPNMADCQSQGIGLGSSALTIDTADVYILSDGYAWTKL